MQWNLNVVGPTLVAMATKFGLGAEIQSPTGLSVHFCTICTAGEVLNFTQYSACAQQPSLTFMASLW